jgi:malate/lactate dehydrogenase
MKITIIGAAGTLGSCAAFNIAVHRLADELVMIDTSENMLKAHWMDLTTAVTGLDIAVHSGVYEDMRGSEIVVMAASAPSGAISSRSELLPINLPILKGNAEKINLYCPGAIVIMETNPVDALNYAMYLMSRSRDRRRFIGYSLNDSIRFRMWAAAALGVRASHVQGTVIGEHGHSQVMLFSSLRVDGKPAYFDEESKRKIREQPSKTFRDFEALEPKRTPGWTSAVGTVTLINAIRNNTREVIPCNAILDGEYGCRRLSMTVPAVIGRAGIQDINTLKLTEDEQEGLRDTVGALSPQMRYVEQYLGIRP